VGVVQLGSNYRSSPQVVAAAAAVLAPPGRRRPPVHAARPDGPVPTFSEYATAEEEARGVARDLRATESADIPWSRLAVLYRVNAQSALFEEALTRAGIPFRVRGGERFLDRPEVQVALGHLRKSASNAPARPFAEHLTDLATEAESLAEERREHADALVRLGHEYLEVDGGRGSVDGFLEFLHSSLRGDDADAAPGRAVELLTFHRAKGLEFDTVFVTGLERGLVPISHAKSTEAMDEEQRLLYVALSRAERGLHLSWARERTVGGRAVRRTRSSWLGRVEHAVHPSAPSTPSTGGAHESIATARERVARARGGSTRTKTPIDVAASDEPLYAALVDWRLKQSRAASAPAYVIFPNTTLAAIATARPRSTRALLDVPGVGPVKADRYGDAVLALVAEHADGSTPAEYT
jgi:DNA helicase-2/ATP-dependent DNA helicase PcrA